MFHSVIKTYPLGVQIPLITLLLYKTQKKAGFVSPFVLSLIVGFVGGAIITTLMIILK